MDCPKIFISWSGDRSRIVAEALRSWLPLVLDRPLVWLSSRDIESGSRWSVELSKVLSESQVGVLVLTSENIREPWVLFEAGALSKDRERSRVLPYLVGLEKADLAGPLGQFQAVAADRAGTWSILETIAAMSGDRVTEEVLKRRFEKFWPEFASCLDEVVCTSITPHTSKVRAEDPFAHLSRQLSDVTELVRRLVATPVADITEATVEETREADLEGVWVMKETDTHLYVQIINGELVGPYCYGGDNTLTSYFHGFKRLGEYWFARFEWIGSPIRGFTFLKHESKDIVSGAWWYEHEFPEIPNTPVPGTGNSSHWIRHNRAKFPRWANKFFERAREGIGPGRLTSR